MATDPSEEVRALLDAAGYANVVAGDRWPDTDIAVLVLQTGGVAPEPVYGYPTAGAYKQPTVQLLVRGEHDGFGEAKRRALSIYDDLIGQTPNNLVAIRAQTEPIYLKRDNSSRPIFSLNFICQIFE